MHSAHEPPHSESDDRRRHVDPLENPLHPPGPADHSGPAHPTDSWHESPVATPGAERPDGLPLAPDDDPGGEKPAPGPALARDLLFGLSMPERAVRSGVGLLGGALRETARRLIPQAFQDSKTYSIMVQQMLDYLVEDVGGVAKSGPAQPDPAGDTFLARKAVGNFLEMAWMATLHVSPMTVLAIVSDVAYGSQVYMEQLGEELKRQGVIAPDSTILNVDDLLGAVSQASRSAATTLDTPPLSIEGLQETVKQTRAAVTRIDPTKLIPQSEIQRVWREMQDLAGREQVSLSEISSTMALQTLGQATNVGRGAVSTVRVASALVDEHILGHYRQAAAELRRDGLYATLAKTSTPYIEAVWNNFSPEKTTLTEDLLSGRLAKTTWQQVRSWWSTGSPTSPPAPGEGGAT